VNDHLPVPAPRQQLALPGAQGAALAGAGGRATHRRRPRLDRVSCLSYGGGFLAAGGGNLCCVWDTRTHALVARLAFGASVGAVWVERGSGTALMVAHGSEVAVFDLPEGRLRYAYRHDAQVSSVHIADAMAVGASIDVQGLAQVHDINAAHLVQRLDTPAGQPKVFLDRARYLVVDSGTHSAFYDVATGALRRRFPYDPTQALSLDAPLTGSTLIAPSGRWLRWFDCAKHAHAYVVRDLGSQILGIDIANDHGVVLAATEGGRINLFGLKSAQPRASHESFTVPLMCACFGADASIYAAGGEALVMHLVQGRHVRSYYDESAPLVSMALPRQAESVLLSDRDGGITPVSLHDGRRMPALTGHQGSVSVVTTFGDRVASGAYDGVVRVFEAASARPLMAIDLEQGPVQAVIADEPAERLWVGTWAGRVNEVDLASGSLRWSVEVFPSSVRSLAHDAERGLLCAGGNAGELRMLAVGGNGPKQVGAGSQPGTVYRVQFDAEGSVFATAGDGVRRYEPGAFAMRALYPGRTIRWFDRAAGRLASLSLSGETSLFDEAPLARRCRASIDTPFSHRSITFLNARRLLVASGDGLMRVFDERLQPVATLELLRDGFVWSTAPQDNGHPGWLHTDRADLIEVGDWSAPGESHVWESADPRRARHLAKWTSASHVMRIVRGDAPAAAPVKGRLASALTLAPIGHRLGWTR
jgi:WD40 repeat protein